jgi:hypothetical protein
MKYQKGTGYTRPRRPRGKCDRSKPGGCYRISPKAYRARLRNAGRRKLVGGKPPRTYGETRCLELEVAMGTHRGETCRAMAKRLNCSHVQCWRLARNYRAGRIQWLPRDEQGLVAMRDSLGPALLPEPEPQRPSRPSQQPVNAPGALTADEGIAETRRIYEEEKRKNRSEGRRRALYSVPFRW